MKINYVIATYNSKTKRYHKYPTPENILKEHLNKIYELKHNLSQITIMCAESNNYYKTYYNINIDKHTIPIKIINVKNYGYSMGQWLKSYELFKNDFDYYLFIEDDYCPNINNFDKLLLNIYSKKFDNNIGLLCSLVQGSDNYKNNKKYPIHFEGIIFISSNTLNLLYNNKKWEFNPLKWLDLIDNRIDNGFNWENQKKGYLGGYYQVSFSHLFTLINIKHEDYLDETCNNNLLQFPYWSDNSNLNIGGKIHFYTKGDNIKENYTYNDIKNSPFIPIQLYNQNSIKFNTNLDIDKPKIIFIIGMHRSGTSLLANCLIENGFSIGKNINKDQNWQNPNGYFENDSFTNFHNNLLNYNNSTWIDINTNNMKYTNTHIIEYRNLLNIEFINKQFILIKDPRLSFFINFLIDVCSDIYTYNFLFLIRDKNECCNSLSKAQNISISKAEKLYDITLNKYNNNYLKIKHNDIIYNNNKVLQNISQFCNINLKYNTNNLVNLKLYRNKNIFINCMFKPIEKYPHRICLDIINSLKKYITNKIVCDLGCGAGDLLEYIKFNDITKNVIGIEYSDRICLDRKYIIQGNLFNIDIPKADVYIIWLGKNFKYEKILKKLKNNSLIILLDSEEENHILFENYKEVELLDKIIYTYDENKFIKHLNYNDYMNELKNLQKINPNWTIIGKRFFKVYKLSI